MRRTCIRWAAANRSRAGRATLATVLAAIALLATAAPAMAITVRAETDRARIRAGERLVLTVTVEGDQAVDPRVDLPVLPGVQVHPQGRSQSFTMADGRVQASVSLSYLLEVTRESDFEIPALRVHLEGRAYSTQPIPITVLAAEDPPPARTPSAAQRGSGTGGADPGPDAGGVTAGSASGGRPGDDVFITLTADRREVHVGEQIVLSFRWYRSVQPWDNPRYTPPTTEGFWREDLAPEQRYRTTVGARTYQVTEVRYALFPTRAGELTIEPATLTYSEDLFDRFFSRARNRGPRALRTDPIPVTVLELPHPLPDDFSGLVAREMALTAQVDRDSVPRGEPVTLSVNLVTDAFLETFGGLMLPEPDGARLHDSRDELRAETGGDRRRSRLTVEKVIIPTVAGTLRVPPVTVRYFDPDRREYVLARTEPAAVTVLPSSLPVAGDLASGPLRTEIARLASDLAFIHPVARRLARVRPPVVASAFWWVALLLPPAALAALRVLLARREALLRDPAAARRRQALARARRRLRQAARSGDRREGLAAIGRAVAGYVADRRYRPPAAVDAREVAQHAAEVGAPTAGERLARLLEVCDRERFGVAGGATAAGSDDLGALAREAEAALADIDRATRRHRAAADRSAAGPVRAGVLLLVVGLTAATAAPAATTGSGDPAQLVAEGNQAYTEGDLDTALERYRLSLDAGVDDAVVHYNLGNVHARRGELGRAVASYLRALRRDPGDRDARANLAWVRAHLKDIELAGEELPPGVAQAAGLGRALTLDQWSLLLVAAVWVLCLLLGWGWWRGGVGERLRRVLLAGLAILVLVGAVTAWRFHDER
ncbi:MAG: BatD family protein, partial [Candidatus Krumholzibacteriia bacterium]